ISYPGIGRFPTRDNNHSRNESEVLPIVGRCDRAMLGLMRLEKDDAAGLFREGGNDLVLENGKMTNETKGKVHEKVHLSQYPGGHARWSSSDDRVVVCRRTNIGLHRPRHRRWLDPHHNRSARRIRLLRRRRRPVAGKLVWLRDVTRVSVFPSVSRLG